MTTAQELAQSLRQIADHARPGMVVDGQQRMVIELSIGRVQHLLEAADMVEAQAPDDGDTEGMGL